MGTENGKMGENGDGGKWENEENGDGGKWGKWGENGDGKMGKWGQPPISLSSQSSPCTSFL